jgi:hypothetical protein|tara:strand:+ start:312 stop:569 length:258 start_codon:yes stop_codon:yes gene_type:complete
MLKQKNLAETIDNNDYTRRNRFTGESIELTKEEADKHDKIFYHEALATLEDRTLGTGASKHWQTMRDLLDWFRKNNAKAYMVLLD